ncbi:MAG: tetratricopeptide repeat protein [Ignavibacteria bacterium]
MKKLFCGVLFIFLISCSSYSQMSELDSGYFYLNQGKTKLAIDIFEKHLKQDPQNEKIHMQLGYIYYSQKQYAKSLLHFSYVGNNSKDPSDLETSKSAMYVIRDEMANFSPMAMDLYFYNFYDTHQKNYIANLLGHYDYKIVKDFYTGIYLDVYTDTRSTPQLIYNDRFFEAGGFLRYSLLRNFFLEFRLGYAREVDLAKNSINIKPMAIYFTRFGDAPVYVGRKSSNRTGLYMDVYTAAMYDYKFRNTFLQGSFQEVLRLNTGGYSYFEPYLVQYGQFDSRRVDYNNYTEIGSGLRFRPDVMYFPVIFVEPTYKVYFYGSVKNSFQVKAGFQFIFKTPL